MSDYTLAVADGSYTLAVDDSSYTLSLSRTGGQGTQGDSITDARISNGDLLLDISNSAGTLLETINVGSIDTLSYNWSDNAKAIFGDGSDLQIYHDGSDNYIISPNADNLLLNPTGGNVGIGTTSPEGELHVVGTGIASGTVEGSTRADLFLVDSGAAVDFKRRTLRADGGNLVIGLENDARNAFTESMRVSSNGSIGVGITDSSSTFSIETNKGLRVRSSIPNYTLQETDSANQEWQMGSYGGDWGLRDITGGSYPILVSDGAPDNSIKISGTGYVGINTGSPAASLHVESQGAALRLQNNNSDTNGVFLDFRKDSGTRSGYVGTTGSGDDISLWNSLVGSLRFATNNSERMRINSSGNVGIGTTSISYNLDVQSSDDTPTLGLRTGNTTGTGTIYFGDTGSTTAGYLQYNHSGDSLAIGTAGTEAMRIDSSGSLLINATSKQNNEEFLVNGEAHIRLNGGSNQLRLERYGSSEGTAVLAGVADSFQVMNTAYSPKLFVGLDGAYAGNVGIGTTGPDGTLHVHTASAGSISANSSADDLVVENDASGGITILTPDTSSSYLNFGSPSDNFGARVGWHQSAGEMIVGSAHAGASLVFQSDNANEAMRISSNGRVGIGETSPFVDLHVTNSASVQLLIQAGSSDNSYLLFGDTDDTNVGFIGYAHASDAMLFRTNNAEAMRIDSSGNVGIGTTSPSVELEVMGEVASDGMTLAAIAETKSDTAVDVFVYDTSKDSDGGKWRKRTQHTSWYNETLNTSTRGSRREFPAVAVIVAESDTVTIYDGDDPDMPMWAIYVVGWDKSYDGVTALNGTVAIANKSGAGFSGNGIHLLTFPADKFRSDVAQITYGGQAGGTSSSLVTTSGFRYPADGMDGIRPFSSTLVNYEISDVAMTVLPNAPADPATGLPVPTIAVATGGGVSVIDGPAGVGTVVDITGPSGYQVSSVVDFIGTSEIIFGMDSGDGARAIRVHDIPSADETVGTYWHTKGPSKRFYKGHVVADAPDLYILGENSTVKKFMLDGVIGSNKGLSVLDENPTTPSEGMVAYTTSDYATGWMNGDIKLATLSDTDDTNVTGSELVTNGTFDSDVSSWTTGATSTFTWNASGYADLDRNSGSGYEVYQDIITVSGSVYEIQGGVLNYSHGAGFFINSIEYKASGTSGGSNETITAVFTATSSSTRVYLGATNAVAATVEWDNVSVRLAEEDRSVNGNGLQVHGTIQKNPVATGADLVGYSGFSASNYLKLPAGSMHLTGEHCFMAWVKTTGTSQMVVTHGERSANKLRCIFITSLGTLAYATYANDLIGTTPVNTNAWTHVVGLYDGNKFKIYVNGLLDGESALSPVAFADVGTLIGLTSEAQPPQPFDIGSLALLRISATAPTAEQIAKIYRDEKVLFQENAKATLYGTSDAVTALAHDDDTNLLHVGTSAGRSVFQGLRRVENTTTAVGTAISASNGLVVEE